MILYSSVKRHGHLAQLVESLLDVQVVSGSIPLVSTMKKALLSSDKGAFFSYAFLAEHDAHFVRYAGFACDARLRRVDGTQRIIYHIAAASLITFLQTG